MADHLFDRVVHRDQTHVVDHVGIARHMARKDVDRRTRAKRLAQGSPFFGDGNEKVTSACTRQAARDTIHPETIGIRLDHRAGPTRRQGVECAPVCGQGVKVDGQGGAAHGRGFDRTVAGVKR